MMTVRSNIFLLLAAVQCISCVDSSTAEKEYPARPIELIVNFSPGDTTDNAARILVAYIQEEIAGDVFITYRPGAGGTLGVNEIARAKSDGYTLGTCNMPAVALIPQLRNVPYDPQKDIVHVAAVMPYEYALFVHADSPWNTWEELIEYAKKNPGKLTYGSVGVGTTNHLVTARIGLELDIDWVHIPFQGGAKATAALLGKHVDFVNGTFSSMAPSVRGGKLRPLLVTSESRIGTIPDVRTMSEIGFNFSQVSYMSIIAPADISSQTRDLLEQALQNAAADRTVQEAFEKLGIRPAFMGGEDYSLLLSELYSEWAAFPELLNNST